MNIFTNHIIDWLMVVILIAGAIYTLRIIGQEKSTFKDEAYEVRFGKLALLIPKWWSITEQTPQTLRFERTDTHYDWFGLFSFIPLHEDKDLPKILSEKLDAEQIEFDSDVVFETDSRVLFRNPEIQEYFQEIIRVEGKATQAGVDRIYCDIYLTRAQGEAGYFIFESRSSVLNGAVEGPFFEESLAELSLIHEA